LAWLQSIIQLMYIIFKLLHPPMDVIFR